MESLKLKFNNNKVIDCNLCNDADKGIVVPFLAISVAVLLGLAALVIDATVYTSSHGELQSTADLAALSALETFTKASADGVTDLDEKIQRIRTSLVNVLSENSVIGKRLDGSDWKLSEDKIGLYSEESGQLGEIIPGFWFYEPPSEGCPLDPTKYDIDSASNCPCDGANFTGPCFAAVRPTASAVNAFKVTLRTDEAIKTTPFGSVLKGLIGGEEGEHVMGNNFGTSAIAALAPSDLLFGVDMSPSMEYQTHFPNHPRLPSFYSFKLNDDITVASPSSKDVTSYCTTGSNPCFGVDKGLVNHSFTHWHGSHQKKAWYDFNWTHPSWSASGYKFETDSSQITHADISRLKNRYVSRMINGDGARYYGIGEHYSLTGELPITEDASGKIDADIIDAVVNEGFYYGSRHWKTDYQRRLNTISTYIIQSVPPVPMYFYMWNPHLVRSSMPGSGIIDRFHLHEASKNYKEVGTVKLNSTALPSGQQVTKILDVYEPHKDYRVDNEEYRTYIMPFTKREPGGHVMLGYIGPDMPYPPVNNQDLGHIEDPDCDFPSSMSDLTAQVKPYAGAPYSVSWKDILDPDDEGLINRFEIDTDNKRLIYRGIDPDSGVCGCDVVYEFRESETITGVAGVGAFANCNPEEGAFTGCKYGTACKFVRRNDLSTCSFSGYRKRGTGDINQEAQAYATEIAMTIQYNARLGGGDNPDINTSDQRYAGREDYICYNASSTDQEHIIDTDILYDQATSTNKADTFLFDRTGTKPLDYIFQLVNKSAEKIREMGTGLDQVGFYGFDKYTPPSPSETPSPLDDLLSLREIELSSPYEEGEFNPEFEKLIEITDTTDNIGGRENAFYNFFFPTYNSQTNGALSLIYALNSMNNNVAESAFTSEYGYTYRKRSLVYITDGIFSCNLLGNCNSNNFAHMLNIYDEIKDTIIPEFITSGISIHSVMVGDSARPHKLLRNSPSGGCMSDKEAIQRDLPLTDGITANLGCEKNRPDGSGYIEYRDNHCGGLPLNEYETPQVLKWQYSTRNNYNRTTGESDSKYFYANEFLEKAVSRATGGRFIPIMKPCNVSWCTEFNAATDSQEIKDAADNFCDALGGGGLDEDSPFAGELEADGLIVNSTENGQTVTDSEGRLTCDIYCRSPEQQLEDFIDELFAENSIVLVSPN